MRSNHVRTAAAFLVPLAAVSFGGCGSESSQNGGPPPYSPDAPAAVTKVVEVTKLKNSSHQALANAMKDLDSSLVDTLNNTTYWSGHSAWHPTDKSRVSKLIQSIDFTNKELLTAISVSNDKGDQLLFVQFAKSLGEARAALDFMKVVDEPLQESRIADGSYHTLHGLLFQTRALMRTFHEPLPVEVFSR